MAMEAWELRGMRCDADRYVACPHCAGPVNVELPVLRYANRLAVMIDSAMEHGGAKALPQIKSVLHGFIVETNTPITQAEMEDAWTGKVAQTTHDIFWAARRASAAAQKGGHAKR